MKFEEALGLMREGKKVKLPKWPPSLAMSIQDGMLGAHEATIASNALSFELIVSEDWEEAK